MNEDCKDVVRKVKAHIEEYELEATVEVVESTISRYQSLDNIEKAAGTGASML